MFTRLLRTGKIKDKLRRLNLVTIGGAFLIATLLLTIYNYYYHTSELVAAARAKAQLIARSSSSAVAFEDAKAASDLLKSVAMERMVRFAALQGEKDAPLALRSERRGSRFEGAIARSDGIPA